MATGRRYDSEPKLNIGKVAAVVVALAVVLMLIISIVNSLNKDKKNKREEISVTTTYFSAYKDGKWGVIDNNGTEIIPPTYEEMVIIPNKEKDLFFVVENQNYTDKTYTTKVLNKKNEVVLSEYTNVEPIQNSLNASIVWYEQDILKYKTDNGYKLINFSGEELSNGAAYSNVYSMPGVENNIIVEANGVKGLVNGSTNQIVLQCSYTDIQTLLPNDYSKGYIVTNTNNKKGVIDANSKIIFECKYDDIGRFTGNDRYYVKENGTWKIVDNQGNTVLENANVANIDSDHLIINNNGQYGLMDVSGQELIAPSYQLIEPAFAGIYIAKKDDKYGLIDVSDNPVVDFKYTLMTYRKEASFIEADKENVLTDVIDASGKIVLSDVIISELNTDSGYVRARVGDEYKYYNLKFEEKTLQELVPTKTLYLVKKDGKYGYENKEGKLVVDCIYDDATEQNMYGYCAIKENGLWGSLKADGTVVVKPSINMDNNIVIDFINDWHMFEDSLINTYVK